MIYRIEYITHFGCTTKWLPIIFIEYYPMILSLLIYLVDMLIDKTDIDILQYKWIFKNSKRPYAVSYSNGSRILASR